MMKPNALKALWAEGKPVLNGWLSIPNAFTAEIMAEQGYDSVTADLQHGLIDDHAVVGMFQAMRGSNVAPLARVPWLDPAAIMKVLDAGAYGVICPMVNTRTEAEALVSYVRYPPNGVRSFGPTRATIVSGPTYAEMADENIVCFAMIETAQAYANLEQIVSTPGLDGVYIGPADLALGLTGKKYRTGFDREEPELLEAIHGILAAAKKAGIRAALHCGTPAYAAKAIGWGFDLVTIANDVRLLAGAASASVSATRAALEKAAPAPTPSSQSGY